MEDLACASFSIPFSMLWASSMSCQKHESHWYSGHYVSLTPKRSPVRPRHGIVLFFLSHVDIVSWSTGSHQRRGFRAVGRGLRAVK